jgi:hypothetical protein
MTVVIILIWAPALVIILLPLFPVLLFQILMSALVVIDFEMYIQPGNCLDDCTIAVAEPYYIDLGCTFSLEGLKDVRRLILSPYLLSFELALPMSLHLSVPHPILQKRTWSPARFHVLIALGLVVATFCLVTCLAVFNFRDLLMRLTRNSWCSGPPPSYANSRHVWKYRRKKKFASKLRTNVTTYSCALHIGGVMSRGVRTKQVFF